jgi:hypothetical protein
VPLVMLSSDPGAMQQALPEIRALGAAPMVQPVDDDELLALLTAPPAAAWPEVRVV